MKYHYVYRITHLPTQKHYYGKRSSEVLPQDDLGKCYFSSSKALTKLIRSEGISAFRFKVIRIFAEEKDAYLLEVRLHHKFKVNENPCFFNLSRQGSVDWRSPLNHSTATKKKMSASHLGHKPWNKGKTWKSLGVDTAKFGMKGANNPFYGKTHSPEVIAKIREANFNNRGENNPFYGKTHSAELKSRLSEYRSHGIRVVFYDGRTVDIKAKRDLGPLIGMSGSYGQKLTETLDPERMKRHGIVKIEDQGNS